MEIHYECYSVNTQIWVSTHILPQLTKVLYLSSISMGFFFPVLGQNMGRYPDLGISLITLRQYF
jgi:hypothetical protein